MTYMAIKWHKKSGQAVTFVTFKGDLGHFISQRLVTKSLGNEVTR